MTQHTDTTDTTRTRRLARALIAHRRGIASVLSMMFLVLFGSLVAAMSIASTGNIRTASMHLHVMRAISAAETGMAVAEARLQEASSRFIVAEGQIDEDLSWALWRGSSGDIGTYSVTPPRMGYSESGLPGGIAEALVNIHGADTNVITGLGFLDDPAIQSAPSGIGSGVYEDEYWVNTPAVMVETWDDPENTSPPPAFQIRYAPLAGGEFIRVIVEGIVYDFTRNAEPIRRTITRDYRMTKSVDQAIIAHSKILIGKNVHIEGDLGTRYDEVDYDTGDPVVMRSDFYGLDSDLDDKIEDFWDALAAADVDRDNRLRFGHPVEGANIPADVDQDGDTTPDGAFIDATGDGYLDDFDIFIRHYDSDNDGRVTIASHLIAGTTAEDNGSSPEFEGIDDDLALLIDMGTPDRNKNGVWGFVDDDNDGKYEPGDGEEPEDFDSIHTSFPDMELGWRDGYLDAMDRYAKVSGSIVFKTTLGDSESNQGPVEERLRGSIVSEDGAPLEFGADDLTLPDIDASSFAETENALIAAADGDPFWQQVADQLSTTTSSLLAWELDDNPGGSDAPYYSPVYADGDQDGRPDNYDWAYFEKAPFNSPSYSDLYYRPVFRNMTFRNVQIPMGLNALFDDCTFVGATYVRTHDDNTHPMWQQYGVNVIGDDGYPEPKYERFVYGDDPGEDASDAPAMLPSSAIPPSQNILMTIPTISPLDKGDVPQSEVAAFGSDYALLPEPLVISGLRVTDTKWYSNNLRFHDCLVVGSIVSDTPINYTQVRNKMQFTGATRFAQVHPEEPENAYLNPDGADMEDIETSSMMLPNYSVDVGTFNSPPEQDVRLTGAIIAGVLDARGNTDITGALLLTFDPTVGEGPMVDVAGNPVGNPAGFNASLGYFGEGDGDFESIDPSDLPLVGGVRIVGYDTTGDGLADVNYDQPQPPGSTPVPFNGFGRITVRHDPDMRLPSGLMLPMSMPAVRGTYREGAY